MILKVKWNKNKTIKKIIIKRKKLTLGSLFEKIKVNSLRILRDGRKTTAKWWDAKLSRNFFISDFFLFITTQNTVITGAMLIVYFCVLISLWQGYNVSNYGSKLPNKHEVGVLRSASYLVVSKYKFNNTFVIK